MSIKKVTQDYGLRQHEVEVFNPETPEESNRLFEALSSMMGPDQARDHNAKLVRDALDKAGIDDIYAPKKIAAKCGEKAFHVLGAEWLRNYEWLRRCRSKIEAGTAKAEDIELLVSLAETLGELKERIWWRHGVDPVTRVKRENLAVSARESRRALSKGRTAVDAHNAEEKAIANQWRRIAQRMADEIWAKKYDLTHTAVAEIIRPKLKKDCGVEKAVSTIRPILKKPDRA